MSAELCYAQIGRQLGEMYCNNKINCSLNLMANRCHWVEEWNICIIKQIKEAYSKVPQETSRNGFRRKAEKSVEKETDQDKEGEGMCERHVVTIGYFSWPMPQLLQCWFCWTHILLGNTEHKRSQQWLSGYWLAPETSFDPSSDNTAALSHPFTFMIGYHWRVTWTSARLGLETFGGLKKRGSTFGKWVNMR